MRKKGWRRVMIMMIQPHMSHTFSLNCTVPYEEVKGKQPQPQHVNKWSHQTVIVMARWLSLRVTCLFSTRYFSPPNDADRDKQLKSFYSSVKHCFPFICFDLYLKNINLGFNNGVHLCFFSFSNCRRGFYCIVLIDLEQLVPANFVKNTDHLNLVDLICFSV